MKPRIVACFDSLGIFFNASNKKLNYTFCFKIDEGSKKNVPFNVQKARDLHKEHQALQQQEADREVVAELLQHHGNGKPVDAQRRQEALQHYATCREERVQDFLRALKQKRDSYFSGLWSETVLA